MDLISLTGFLTKGKLAGVQSTVNRVVNFWNGDQSTFERMAARPDPAMNYTWKTIMPFGLSDDYVESIDVSLPGFESSESFMREGRQEQFADRTNVGTVSITLYEDSNLLATQWYMRWRELVQNPDGTFNAPVQYKQPLVLIPTTVTGDEVARITMIGTFPTGADGLNFASSSPERLTLKVTLSVDAVHIQFPGQPAQSSGESTFGKIVGAVNTGISVWNQVKSLF